MQHVNQPEAEQLGPEEMRILEIADVEHKMVEAGRRLRPDESFRRSVHGSLRSWWCGRRHRAVALAKLAGAVAGSSEQLLAFVRLALVGPTTYSRSRTASKAPQRSRKSPSQARSRATVDVILEATARVLSRRGYAGTDTNRIAEIAGVSVGSIDQHFPNREALVAALCDRHSRDMHILFQRVVGRNAAGSLLDGLAAIVGALMQAHREDVALHMILERKLAFHEQKSGDAIRRSISLSPQLTGAPTMALSMRSA
jgi:AcrR family transcriptional regulator